MTEFNKLFSPEDCDFLDSLDVQMQRAPAPREGRLHLPEWLIRGLVSCAAVFGGYVPLDGQSTDPQDKI